MRLGANSKGVNGGGTRHLHIRRRGHMNYQLFFDKFADLSGEDRTKLTLQAEKVPFSAHEEQATASRTRLSGYLSSHHYYYCAAGAGAITGLSPCNTAVLIRDLPLFLSEKQHQRPRAT